MASAISGYISQIQNAVYGEQVRSAIVNALLACYSDVENPDLQSAAFQTAIEAAYQDGILDIITVTSFNDMTNQNIIYRYNGTAAGKQKGLYYYSALSSSWVLIGSEIQKVSLLSQMTDVNDIYKYTGTESGMVQNSLYCHNGTSWVPIGSGVLTASTASQMTNQNAIYKYTGNETGYITNSLYYYNGTAWVPVGITNDATVSVPLKGFSPVDATDTYLSYGWTASTEGKRVSNWNNPAPVKKGDIVKLKGETSDFRFYVRLFVNGTLSTKNGWYSGSNTYTVPTDGELVVSFGNINDTASRTLVPEAEELLLIESKTVVTPYVGFSATEDRAIPINMLNMGDLVSGYIPTSGDGLTTQNSTAGAVEKTTPFLEVAPNGRYTVRLEFPTGIPSGLGVWGCWKVYDEDFQGINSGRDGTFIKSVVRPDGTEYAMMYIRIPNNEDAKYLRVSFRTFGNALVSVVNAIDNPQYFPSFSDLQKLQNIQSNPAPVSIKFPIKSVNHRGYRGTGAHENTLNAFRASKTFGFDFVECDVYEVSDGGLFLHHDATISINGTTKNMTACTTEEIESVIWSDGSHVPTFEEFIALCKNIDLYPYIEIKTVTDSGIGRMVDICKAYGIIEKCTWISFGSGNLGAVSKYYPMARLGFLGNGNADGVGTCLALRNGINEVFLDTSTTTQAAADLCEAAGVPMECWTISGEGMLSLPGYVSGVTSDGAIYTKVLYDANISPVTP